MIGAKKKHKKEEWRSYHHAFLTPLKGRRQECLTTSTTFRLVELRYLLE